MSDSNQWTPEKWQQTTAALMRRAATDVPFRQKCLTDPKGAVKEISGIDLHANARIRFVEPAQDIVLTLPALRATAELSDQQLESVAGAGESWKSWFINNCQC
jgi:hypothetical protein